VYGEGHTHRLKQKSADNLEEKNDFMRFCEILRKTSFPTIFLNKDLKNYE
jgi:hypothetical protein